MVVITVETKPIMRVRVDSKKDMRFLYISPIIWANLEVTEELAENFGLRTSRKSTKNAGLEANKKLIRNTILGINKRSATVASLRASL